MLGTLIYLKHIHVRIDNICQNHCLVHTTYLFSDFSICLNTVDLLIDLAIVLTGMKTRMGLFGQLKCICVLCVSQIVGWMSISSALRWCPMTANRTWSTWRRFTAVISPHSSRLITLNDPWWWTCAYERSNHEVTNSPTLIYTKHRCRDIKRLACTVKQCYGQWLILYVFYVVYRFLFVVWFSFIWWVIYCASLTKTAC